MYDACVAAWTSITGNPDRPLLTRAFEGVQKAFAGGHPGYERLDTRYHDLEHTLQGTLCLARLLAAWHDAAGLPALNDRAVRLGLLAILLHDTGYLKFRGDSAGTGAKFTLIHVQRSADFAGLLLRSQGFPSADIQEVQSMIRCTGVNVDVRALTFEGSLTRRVGCALGSADLLGQMAAEDYVDKLPALHAEFAEAAAAAYRTPAAEGLSGFQSAQDLIQRTPGFWTHYVLPRLETEFEGVYRYLNRPYPNGPNEYLRLVSLNINRIRDQFMVAA